MYQKLEEWIFSIKIDIQILLKVINPKRMCVKKAYKKTKSNIIDQWTTLSKSTNLKTNLIMKILK